MDDGPCSPGVQHALRLNFWVVEREDFDYDDERYMIPLSPCSRSPSSSLLPHRDVSFLVSRHSLSCQFRLISFFFIFFSSVVL